MGLQRKRRGVQIRLAEVLGALLLCATIGLGANWFLYQQRAYGWNTAQATVTGVLPRGGNGSAGASPDRQLAVVYYTYTVGGRTYTGSTAPNVLQRTLASILPTLIMRQLNARGIYTFADLPEEVRRVIREGTDRSFDELPDAERNALASAGYKNVEQLRTTMLSAMESRGVSATRGAGDSASDPMVLRARQFGPSSPTAAVSVPILFDPSDPSRSEIVTSARTTTSDLAGLVGLVLLAALTCCYFALAYPWLKTHGY